MVKIMPKFFAVKINKESELRQKIKIIPDLFVLIKLSGAWTEEL